MTNETTRREGADVPDDGTPLPGEPVNPDELAPKEQMPDPPEGGGTQRHPDAIETEPGMDL